MAWRLAAVLLLWKGQGYAHAFDEVLATAAPLTGKEEPVLEMAAVANIWAGLQHGAAIACTIALAFTAKRCGVLQPAKAAPTLAAVLVHFTLPASIVRAVTPVRIRAEHWCLAAICVSYSTLLMLPLTLVVGRRVREPHRCALLAAGLLGFGIGEFAYPIVEALWGPAGFQFCIFFDLGNAVPCFVYLNAYFIHLEWKLSSGTKREALLQRNARSQIVSMVLRIARFPPLLAFALALGANVANVELTGLVSELLDTASRANGLLVYLLLGIYMDFSLSGIGERDHGVQLQRVEVLTIVGSVLAVRLCMGLAAGSTLFLFLRPAYGSLYVRVLLACLLLPPPPVALALLVQFELGNSKVAGLMVNMGICFALVAMLLIYCCL